MRTIGVGIMSNNKGQDIMELLYEMNDCLGTTFDLTTSNQEGMVQLVNALKSGSNIAKDFVASLEHTGELDFSEITGQVEDAAKAIYPDIKIKSKKSERAKVDKDGFMVPPDDDDEFSFLWDDEGTEKQTEAEKE